MPKTKKPTELAKEIEKKIDEMFSEKLEEKTTWETSNAPLREPTPEQAKVIEEFIKNPEIASEEDIIELEKELGIKLNFTRLSQEEATKLSVDLKKGFSE